MCVSRFDDTFTTNFIPWYSNGAFLTLSKGFSFLLRGTRCILHSWPVRAVVAPFTIKVYFAVFRYPIHLLRLNLVSLMSG